MTPALAARAAKAEDLRLKVLRWSTSAAAVGAYFYWWTWRERIREHLYPRNTVGPFGTPGAMFCIVRRPDGSRVLDDLVGSAPEAQSQLLAALEAGEVWEFHGVQLEEA